MASEIFILKLIHLRWVSVDVSSRSGYYRDYCTMNQLLFMLPVDTRILLVEFSFQIHFIIPMPIT